MERTTDDVDARAAEERRQAPETESPMRSTEDDGRTTQRLATADLADARPAEGPGQTAGQPVQTTSPASAARDDGPAEPLLDEARSGQLRARWESVQASFVDEPRQAVEQADGLVAEVLQDLARSFTRQREALEKEWQLGDDVSTEELRQALRHYRSFFDRLLSL